MGRLGVVSAALMCACTFAGPPGPGDEGGGGGGDSDFGMNTIDAAPDATLESICASTFGSAESFELCVAEGGTCMFYARTANMDCAAMCAGFSGTCVDSFDGDCESPSNNSGDCAATLGDQICVCAPP